MATPMPARRYSSCEPVSAADTLNLRCNSATTGRITERFCLSERTSPSSTSNSSQPIHIVGSVAGCGRGRRDLCGPESQQHVGGLRRQLPPTLVRREFHREGELGPTGIG